MRIVQLRSIDPISPRRAAALIALLAWINVAGLYYVHSDGLLFLRRGFYAFTSYYSNFSVVLVAIIFSGIALDLDQFRNRRTLGHALVTLTLMMVMYWSFRGIDHYVASRLVGMFAHGPLFVIVLGYWLYFQPPQPAQWPDVLQWPAFSLIYTSYSLTRGYYTKDYPYPQANFEVLGVLPVAGMILLSTVLTLLTGCALVLLDRHLSARRSAIKN